MELCEDEGATSPPAAPAAAAGGSSGGGGGGLRLTTLGPDPAAGHALQHVVPAGVWFGAFPLEGTRYSLVGCTVAPAFRFESFEFGERGALLARFPHAAAHIDRLLPEGEAA